MTEKLGKLPVPLHWLIGAIVPAAIGWGTFKAQLSSLERRVDRVEIVAESVSGTARDHTTRIALLERAVTSLEEIAKRVAR